MKIIKNFKTVFTCFPASPGDALEYNSNFKIILVMCFYLNGEFIWFQIFYFDLRDKKPESFNFDKF